MDCDEWLVCGGFARESSDSINVSESDEAEWPRAIRIYKWVPPPCKANDHCKNANDYLGCFVNSVAQKPLCAVWLLPAVLLLGCCLL
jgi:hypothetical protein